jgi:hypothetical protein
MEGVNFQSYYGLMRKKIIIIIMEAFQARDFYSPKTKLEG